MAKPSQLELPEEVPVAVVVEVEVEGQGQGFEEGLQP